MKGVVVENRNGASAVLAEDGRIIRQKGIYPVGSEIDVYEKKAVFSARRLSLACMCVLFMMVSCLVYRDYTWTVLAYSTITVQNGTTIEYTLNRKGNIIGVRGFDEASIETAEQLSETVMNQSGTEAVETYIRMSDPGQKIDVHVFSREKGREEELIRQLDAAIDQEEFPNVHTGRDITKPENARQGRMPAGEENFPQMFMPGE